MRKNNRVERRVSVVMSDPWHRLHLIEAKTNVRRYLKEDGSFGFRVDKTELEEFARGRLPKPDKPWQGYDLVGVLVADDTIEHKGRITWADEIETREAIEV